MGFYLLVRRKLTHFGTISDHILVKLASAILEVFIEQTGHEHTIRLVLMLSVDGNLLVHEGTYMERTAGLGGIAIEGSIVTQVTGGLGGKQ